MSLNSHRPRPALRTVATVLAVGLFGVLAACGGDDDGDSAEPEATTTTAAVPDADVTVVAEDIDFPTKAYTAAAGDVTLAYVNEGDIRHTLVIDGVSFDKLVVDKEGDVDTGSVSLEPGEYTLFCDISGHRGAGMEATLTVE